MAIAAARIGGVSRGCPRLATVLSSAHSPVWETAAGGSSTGSCTSDRSREQILRCWESIHGHSARSASPSWSPVSSPLGGIFSRVPDPEAYSQWNTVSSTVLLEVYNSAVMRPGRSFVAHGQSRQCRPPPSDAWACAGIRRGRGCGL